MQRKPFRSSMMAVAVASALGITDYAAAQAMVLEEVVVTARKRSESLQDVPMAVSAFNTRQLQNAMVNGMEDLERMTPNLTLTETGGLQSGAVAVFIRGIGNDPQFDQGVGIYVDDVYMNRATGALLEVYDVERIEILKGPQGNLYGRNTIGGAIKYVSREPSEDLVGDLEFKTGSDGLVQIKGNVSGPLTDSLKGSFGALYRQRDGWQENTFDGEEFWDQDISAFRGSLVWDATDSLRVKLSGDYFKDDSNPRVPVRSGVDAATMAGIDFFITGANFFLAPGTGVRQTPNDVSLPTDVDLVSTEQTELLKRYQIESTTLALTVDWDISDSWSMKSITAQRNLDHVQPFDFDGSEQRFIHTINDRDFEDFSQELQFNYEGDAIKAVMGLYYLDGEADIPSAEPTLQYPRLLATRFQSKDTYQDNRKITSQSVYANVDWDINDQWQLSIGGRYTKDEKDNTVNADTTQQLFALALGNTPFGVVPFAIAPGQEATAAASPNFIAWATPFTEALTITFPEPLDPEDEWTEFSPSARLSWSPDDDVMLYAGFSSGFKSGGFNTSTNNSSPYSPEIVDAYTLGIKSTFLGGSLRLNGEWFLNDYQDKQLATIGLVQGNLEQFVDNVGELETSGFELEMQWLPPVEGLSIGLNVGYLDVDVNKFTSAEGDRSETTAIGFSPQWSVQSRLAYEFALADWGSMLIGTDVNYRTRSFTSSPIDLTSQAAAAQVQEEHAIWNALAAFTSADERWRVALEGKNLEDKRVITNTFNLTLFQTAGYNAPRTWALSVAYEF